MNMDFFRIVFNIVLFIGLHVLGDLVVSVLAVGPLGSRVQT